MTFSYKYRFFIIYIFTVFLVIFGITIAFANDFVFNSKIEVSSLSRNIFPDDIKLKKTIISFKSNYSLINSKLSNSCIFKSSFVGKNEDVYFFDLSYKANCIDKNIFLQNIYGENIAQIEVNLFSEFDLWSSFVDLSDSDLISLKPIFSSEIEKIKQIENKQTLDFFYTLQNTRKIDENNYKIKIINNIIELRKQKYTTPVLGHYLSTKESKSPNSPRPYRETYTFGIHEGWDIDASVGTPVQALDDGMIIRIVSGFKFEDLQKINHKDKTLETKILNLDILRGNQVWLKTAKGDVVFYGHLDSIADDLKVGDLVIKGRYFGNIGISGVPDKNYKDSHLHFEIHKNPYVLEKVGKNSFMDYMSWSWYFKGNTAKYATEHQNEVFDNLKK